MGELKDKEFKNGKAGRGVSALTRLLDRLLPWRTTVEELRERKKRLEAKKKKLEECYEFAEIGDTIKYLDVEVTVVGYNDISFGSIQYIPGLQVKWFNKQRELQRAFINHQELQLCEKKQAV